MKKSIKYTLGGLAIAASLGITYIMEFGVDLRDFYRSNPNLRWTEDVLLSDGKQIVVMRELVGLKGFGGIGDSGGVEAKAYTITFPKDMANAPTQLSTHFIPMMLNQTVQGQWYVLAIIQTCDDWTQIGYPKLPYTQYNWANGAWQQVPLDPIHIGQTANLLVAILKKTGEPPHHTLKSKMVRLTERTVLTDYREIVGKWDTNCWNSSKKKQGH